MVGVSSSFFYFALPVDVVVHGLSICGLDEAEVSKPIDGTDGDHVEEEGEAGPRHPDEPTEELGDEQGAQERGPAEQRSEGPRAVLAAGRKAAHAAVTARPHAHAAAALPSVLAGLGSRKQEEGKKTTARCGTKA